MDDPLWNIKRIGRETAAVKYANNTSIINRNAL